MVVEPQGTVDKVHGGRDVCRLDGLRLLELLHSRRLICEIMKCEVACAEIHCRGDAELERTAQTQLACYAYSKSIVPAVLVAGDESLACGSVLVDNGLHANVDELQVLKVCSCHDAEMEWA